MIVGVSQSLCRICMYPAFAEVIKSTELLHEQGLHVTSQPTNSSLSLRSIDSETQNGWKAWLLWWIRTMSQSYAAVFASLLETVLPCFETTGRLRCQQQGCLLTLSPPWPLSFKQSLRFSASLSPLPFSLFLLSLSPSSTSSLFFYATPSAKGLPVLVWSDRWTFWVSSARALCSHNMLPSRASFFASISNIDRSNIPRLPTSLHSSGLTLSRLLLPQRRSFPTLPKSEVEAVFGCCAEQNSKAPLGHDCLRIRCLMRTSMISTGS